MRLEVPYSELVPTEEQARKHYHHVAELAESIHEHGLLHNLVCRKRPDGKYEVEAGERRRRAIGLLLLPVDDQLATYGRILGDWENVAAEKSGCKQGGVPIFIRPTTVRESINLIENIERENLHVWEVGRRLVEHNDAGQTYDQIASHLQKSIHYVQERIYIGRYLSPKVTDALERIGGEEFLSLADLRKIAQLHDPFLQEPNHVAQVQKLEELLGKTKAQKGNNVNERNVRSRVYDRAARLKNLKRIPGHARPYVKAIYEYLFSPGLMQKGPRFDWD